MKRIDHILKIVLFNQTANKNAGGHGIMMLLKLKHDKNQVVAKAENRKLKQQLFLILLNPRQIHHR